MNNKTKKLLIFFALFSFCIFSNVVFAQQIPTRIEILYPTLVPGVPPPQTYKVFLPSYIRYIYTFVVFSGGLISLLALLYGGVRFLTSSGNPGAMADAREQILAGILGLFIVFGSYVVLHEINPELTDLRLPNIAPARKGIIVYNDQNCGEGRGNGLPELADLPPDIHYLAISETTKLPEAYTIGSLFSFHSGGQLSVLFYENKECLGTPIEVEIDLQADQCIQLPQTIRNVHCIRLIWRLPGVWLFAYPWGNPLDPGWNFQNNSPGYPYAHFQTSQDSLEPPLNNNVQSLALVVPRDQTGAITARYGVILHNNAGGLMSNKGWSEVYLPDSRQNFDITVYNLEERHRGASSITVFTIPTNPPSTDPVILCRNPGCSEEIRIRNNQEEYIYPQLRVWWQGYGDADVSLEDITAQTCNNRNMRSVDSSNLGLALSNPEGWSNGQCNGFQFVVGGARIGGANHRWRDGLRNFEIINELGVIPARKRENGASAIYLPEGEDLLAFLFYDIRNEEPLTLITNSADENVWKSAAGINGSVPDLSTLRWNDKVSTLIIIRIRGP